ncbi:MAG: LOG family protein [Planctomycetes bacterium]|nr:LOG family protein [Planctomycetota bacterium]
MKQTIVTVFGSGQAPPISPAFETAKKLGRAIAQAGWTLCNGGYGGTMQAAAQGAFEVGGHTIGVTCKIFGRSGPNEFIRQEVPTFDLLQRLNTLVRLGRAYVVLPGGTGTMLELALAWELMNKKLLRSHRPIILLGDHWHPVLEPITREQPDALELHRAEDVPAALRVLTEHFAPES